MYPRIATRRFEALHNLARLVFLASLVLGVWAYAARAAQSLPVSSLHLFPAEGVPCAPCEIPIKGVSTAADWAALRVEVEPGYPLLNAEIDPLKKVLRFTPVTGGWWGGGFTLKVLSDRYPSASATLALHIARGYGDFTSRVVEYTATESPAALVNDSLVVYPQGRRENEIAICFPSTPTDFALSSDGLRAYALFESTGKMQVVDLAALRLGAEVSLAGFAKSDYYTKARGRIALGAPGQVFSLDGLGVVRRQSLATGATLQTLPKAPAPRRWADIAVSPDGKTLWILAAADNYQMVQPALFRAPLDAKGVVGAAVLAAQPIGPDLRNYGDTPLSSRILQSRDGRTLAVDRSVFSVTSEGELGPRRELPAEAHSLTASGALIGLAQGGVCDLATDRVFAAQNTNPYYSSRPPIYFFGGTYLARAPWKTSLAEQYSDHVLEPVFEPGTEKVVLPSALVSWPAFPGASSTRAELRETARQSGPLSPALTVADTVTEDGRLVLSEPLRSGSTYEWRLRPGGFAWLNAEDTTALAADFGGSFTVSDAVPVPQRLDLETIECLPAYEVSLRILTATADTAWRLQSNETWLQPITTSGTGPATVTVRIDATTLFSETPNRSGALTLYTATGVARIPVALTVLRPTYTQIIPHPADERCFALAATPWPRARWLVELNTATARITRGRPVPANTDKILYHPDDDAIYLRSLEGETYGGTARLHAAAVGDLSLRTLGELPRNDVFAPAGPGRLAVLAFSYNDLEPTRLIDTATGVSTPGPSLHRARGLVAPDGRSLYRFLVTLVPNQGYQGRVEKVSLTAPDFPILGTQLVHASYDGWIEYAFLGPDRLLVGGREFDLDLNPLPATAHIYPELPSTLASGSLRLGKSLAYDLTAPGSPRRLTSESRVKTLNPSTGRFVVVLDDARTLYCVPWSALAPATVPTIAAEALAESSVTIVTANLPAGAASRISYRIAGTETWTDQRHDSAVVSGLQPDTPYEFRTRFISDGISSAWSEPLSARTLIAAPRWDYMAQQPGSEIGLAGSPFSYVATVRGSDLAITVQDLPPGLVYDPETRTISGTPVVGGRFSVKIIAQNTTGTLEHTVRFLIEAESARANSARYAGLVDLTESAGPLIGEWRATRSGKKITGVYHSALFTLPFKITFTNAAYHDPLTSYGHGVCTYLGVPIHLSAAWDKVEDRITLSGSTSDLVENYHFTTAEAQGQAGHWSVSVKPCPHAARFTGLLLAEGEGPEGHGFLTATINAAGVVSTVGETALGTKFTHSSFLSDARRFPFFHRNGAVLMAGEIGVEPQDAGPRLLGLIDWAKDTRPKAAAYPDGFEQSLLVIGAPLPPAGKTLPPLKPLANAENRADLLLSDGALDAYAKPITQALTPSDTGLVAPKAGLPSNPNRVSVQLNAQTGIVTGTAAILDAATRTKPIRTLSFRGLLVKNPLGDGEDIVGGYFLMRGDGGHTESGLFEITEPASAENP